MLQTGALPLRAQGLLGLAWQSKAGTLAQQRAFAVHPADSIAPPHRLGLKLANATVLVGVGLLRSHAGVGEAVASCGSGCACAPERFVLLHRALVRP